MSSAARGYTRTKPFPPRKVRIVEEAARLLQEYSYVFIFDLHKLKAGTLHEYRYRLRPYGVVKIIKPTLFRIAFARVFGEIPPDIAKRVRGEVGFLFTNANPVEIVRVIAENSVRRAARPGDTAPYDIAVPAGPTSASPGPIISKFSKLKIPIRVQEGKIWVAKDTIIVKAGQQITPEVAEVLRVVGIKPVFEQLRLLGMILRGRRFVEISELAVDASEYRKLLESAVTAARNLALSIVYPAREVLYVVLPAAHARAVALAARLAVIARETLPLLVSRAAAEAAALAAALAQRAPELGLQVAQATQAERGAGGGEARKPEVPEKAGGEKKEGPGEEEVAGALASLF
jgi:large subunit ribosomal protein L10